jgi:hypothetical protein
MDAPLPVLADRLVEISQPAYIRADNLWTLADLTQQLYLDLDPFDARL